MPLKKCSWGLCKSDSRYKDRPHMEGVTFRPFPKPKKQRERCMYWILMCNRPQYQLNVDKITRYHYVCSKHFEAGSQDPVPAITPDRSLCVRRATRNRVRKVSNLIEMHSAATHQSCDEELLSRLGVHFTTQADSRVGGSMQNSALGTEAHNTTTTTFGSLYLECTEVKEEFDGACQDDSEGEEPNIDLSSVELRPTPCCLFSCQPISKDLTVNSVCDMGQDMRIFRIDGIPHHKEVNDVHQYVWEGKQPDLCTSSWESKPQVQSPLGSYLHTEDPVQNRDHELDPDNESSSGIDPCCNEDPIMSLTSEIKTDVESLFCINPCNEDPVMNLTSELRPEIESPSSTNLCNEGPITNLTCEIKPDVESLFNFNPCVQTSIRKSISDLDPGVESPCSTNPCNKDPVMNLACDINPDVESPSSIKACNGDPIQNLDHELNPDVESALNINSCNEDPIMNLTCELNPDVEFPIRSSSNIPNLSILLGEDEPNLSGFHTKLKPCDSVACSVSSCEANDKALELALGHALCSVSGCEANDKTLELARAHALCSVSGCSNQGGLSIPAGYKCRFCDKPFFTKSGLTTHEKSHWGERQFGCSVCHKLFPCQGSMDRHIKMHQGEETTEATKQVECEFCGRLFAYTSLWRTHLRFHLADKPYRCDVCNFSCKTRYNLTSHQRMHSETKRYLCELCGKSYKRSESFKRHALVHRKKTSRVNKAIARMVG